MKFFKVFLITAIALLFSGCYTQLQYSQKMKEATDQEKGKVYSWDDEKETEEVEEEYTEYEDKYAPLYFKDYEYQQKYKDCACNPYNVYNFYGNDWYGYNPYYSYGTYLSLSSSFFYRRHHPYYYGHSFYPRFAFSFSWGWGSPHFYHRFYDPFYDYYWYGYRPYAYGYGYYGGYYYYDKKDRVNRNARYGPRSIGTNRVVTNGNRSRSERAVTGRSRATVTSKPTVRTRSVGTSRTKTSSDRTTVRSRTRSSSGNDKGTSRSRSRDNFQSSRDFDYTDRVNRTRQEVSKEYQRSRLQNLNLPTSNTDLNERTKRSRSTFFDRMKSFFEDNTSRIINSSRIRSNSTIRSRSGSSSPSRSTVSRNKSSNRSSVTRSRSSSSNSRSRGSSSRSRSSGGSSGSDRSRGN